MAISSPRAPQQQRDTLLATHIAIVKISDHIQF